MRPEWLRPGSILLVFLGGCAGAGLREALVAMLPDAGPIPTAILVANLLGAFLLGVLLEALIRSTGRGAARARLLIGTGLIGGFTTYSALALGIVEMAMAGPPWVGLAYGLVTVIVGGLLSWAGIAVAVAARRGLDRRPGPQAGGDADA